MTAKHPKYRRCKNGESLQFLEEIVSKPPDECVLWPYGRNGGGYGIVYKGRKSHLAHRLALQLYRGEPPSPRHFAAHRCGKGHLGCINPRCCYWATQKENMADAARHGTTVRGERSNLAKLTAKDVIAIRADSRPQRAIAKSHRVTQGTISAIKLRKTWGHVQ